MSYNEALRRIPVVAVNAPKAKPNNRLHWARRAVQWGVLALAILIPVSGLFRIDPVDGAFVVLDRQIWFSDFFIVVGFWVLVASGLVLLYSLAGTVFCGWACPQNTFSEWANMMTRRFLGKRAEVMLDGERMRLAAEKNTWLNWLALGAIFLAVSMALALIPLLYFYPPSVVWSFITFQDDARLAGSLHWIYSVFVMIIFLDIAVIRHFMCRFMCIYKVWQHTFKTQQTLHVAYDSSRADACLKCNYCVTSCFLGIDPRKTDVYDTCTNCGECITACHKLHAKKSDQPGLLRFAIGARDRSGIANSRTGLGSFSGRLVWTMPFVVLGAVMFIWGLASFTPYHLAVYKSDTPQALHVNEYRISLAHKLYRPGQVQLRVDGLPESAYRLSEAQVTFASTGRQDVLITIAPDVLPSGLHPFVVHAGSPDGTWEASFRVHHFVASQRS